MSHSRGERRILGALILVLSFALIELVLLLLGYAPWIPLAPQQSLDRIVEADEVTGWRLRPGTQELHTKVGDPYTLTVTTDHTRYVAHASEKRSKRLLIVGDSSVFGWGISDPQTVGTHLAQRLPEYEVVHAAVPAYGILQSYLRALQLAKVQHFDAVIVGAAKYLFPRDVGDLTWAKFIAGHMLAQNVNLPVADIEQGVLAIRPPRPYFFALPLREYLVTARLAEEVAAIPGAVRRVRQQSQIEDLLFRTIQEELRTRVQKLALLVFEPDGLETEFGRTFSEISLPVLRCVHPKVHDEVALVRGDGHPNELQHAFWAECIAGAIRDS